MSENIFILTMIDSLKISASLLYMSHSSLASCFLCFSGLNGAILIYSHSIHLLRHIGSILNSWEKVSDWINLSLASISDPMSCTYITFLIRTNYLSLCIKSVNAFVQTLSIVSVCVCRSIVHPSLPLLCYRV